MTENGKAPLEGRGQRRKRSRRPEPLPTLIYGHEPEELGGEDASFVLALKPAALVAASAWQAGAWGEFARLAGYPLPELLEGWGEEIQDMYGRLPAPTDPFSWATTGASPTLPT